MNGYGAIQCCSSVWRASRTSPNDLLAEPVANYAYLRVSTNKQDVENQQLGVLDYCNRQGIAPIEFVEDTTSGRRSWRDREIGRLLENAEAGDVLVAAEASRLARSALQVLELLQAAAERGLTVHIAKNRMVLDQSLPATITATILGARGTDRAGVYLGQDEGGARAPQSSGTARRPTERPSHETAARRSPCRDRRLPEQRGQQTLRG